MSEVPIAGPADRPSAELAVAMLNGQGIHARVEPGPLETTWTIGAPTRVNPVRILVPEEDAARAQALLGKRRSVPAAGPSKLGIAALIAMVIVGLLLVGGSLMSSLIPR